MQKIRSILKITGSGAALCDAYGSETGIALELMLGTGCILEFDLRQDSSGGSAELPAYPADDLGAAAFYCAMDTGQSNSDDPLLLIYSAVTLKQENSGKVILSVPVDSGLTNRLAEVIKGGESATFFCELGGFDGEGRSVFAWQFKISFRNRVYLGDGNESVTPDPAYYTAVQVDAIAAGLEKKITGSAFEPAAENISVADAGNLFAGSNVEMILQELGSRMNEAERQVNDFETPLNTLDRRLEDAENLLTGLDDRMKTSESSLNEVKSSVSSLENSVDDFDDRMGTAENSLSGLADRMGTAENSLSGLADRMGTAENSLNEVKNSLTGVAGTLTGFDDRMGTVESILTGVENLLGGI